MIRRSAVIRCGVFVVCALIPLLGEPVNAASIVFDSDTGDVRVDGILVNDIGGTSFTSTLKAAASIRRWYFAGGLVVGAGDTVTGHGANGISLMVANNATLAGTFNFSAPFAAPGPGGDGAGGSGGTIHLQASVVDVGGSLIIAERSRVIGGSVLSNPGGVGLVSPRKQHGRRRTAWGRRLPIKYSF
jgi:hypothetical protein